jgi:hypothetical protein
MVLRSGVARSMSRSGGVAAHSHVGDGHVGVYGIDVDWKRDCALEKERMARGIDARGSRAKDMLSCVNVGVGDLIVCKVRNEFRGGDACCLTGRR